MTYRNFLLLTCLLVIASMLILISDVQRTGAQTERNNLFDSPIEPTTTPTPPPSPEAEAALRYVVERYGIPRSNLQVVGEETLTFALIGRTFRALTLLSLPPSEFRDFMLLVDMTDGHIEEDINAIRAQEQAAYTAKYGKLQPDLYERLQKANDTELIPIAIWVSSDPVQRTQEELYQALIDKYAEAAKSMQIYGVPWRVEDKGLAEQIRNEYFQMLFDDNRNRVQPLVDALKASGAMTITIFDGMPSITANLSKELIYTIEKHEDVETIYLIEGETIPSLAEAIPIDRVPVSWYQGTLSGQGRRIAILEPTNIQNNTGCLTIVATRTAPNGTYPPDHKTVVSSVAGCNHNIYRGMAYNASLVDAAFDGTLAQPDMATAVAWAAVTQASDVINTSISQNTERIFKWTDLVLDYWARQASVVIVVASGNDGVNVNTPGKGWNTITVGAIDDKGNSNWSDDTMWSFSSYINPTPGSEKPDVVAPGVNITMVGPNGNLYTSSGTSLSAPQVSGMAALLMNRRNELIDRPEAIKAIIMASAAHNVDGARTMPTSQDLKDGAGSIDVSLGEQVAANWAATNTTCDQPCWWATDNIAMSPNVYTDRFIKVNRGERIRVAIAWWSKGDSAYASDNLYTNYNLYIYNPAAAVEAASASINNSTELVEFVVPATGTYTIRVQRSGSDSDSNESSNEIGIAWTKQATYLPDTRRNSGGWTSKIYVRNDGALARDAKITFFDANGFAVAEATPSGGVLAANAVWSDALPPDNWQGSAIVDGSEDLSVVVSQERSGTYTHEAYPGVSNPAAAVRVPIFQKNNSGFFSDLFVQNAGTLDIKVDLRFIASTGSSPTCNDFRNIVVKPGAAFKIPASDLIAANSCDVGTTFVGSVQVSNSENQPLAIASTQYNVSGGVSQLLETSNTQLPATTLYAPLVQNNNSGYFTGLVLGRTAVGSFDVRYYNKDTGVVCMNQFTLGNNPQIIHPAPPTGNPCPTVILAKFDSLSPMVANVNQLKTGVGATTYAAIANPSRVAIIAKVRRDSGWGDAFVIANYNSVTANITVQLYNANGTFNSTPINNQPLNANNSRIVGTFPVNFNGSAVITADQPVAVIANSSYSGAGDILGSYPANHR